MLIKVFICAIMLSFFGKNLQDSDDASSKKITVIGTALNAKGSAVVETDKGHYFLEGLHAWDEKYYGKKVKVTGKLKIVVHEQQSNDNVEVQEWVGTRTIIKKAKWSLVE